MLPELNLKLLDIAHDLSKMHIHDYTAERVIATYWKIYVLFEQTGDGLANRNSSISSVTALPLLSNLVQE